ncbi:MAG: metal ABC transporter ATP-binding protein [Polyangiaceae bacterium]
MDEPPLLEVQGLGVRVENLTLLDGVTFQVARGSVHLVVGANGAGKSTLLAALLGQVAFTGSVQRHWQKSGKVAYVPQAFAVDSTLPVTALELLALTRQRLPVCFGVRAATRQRSTALLDRVGLTALADRRLSALSGGELRRVLFANAIDPEPELLLLDEPGAGMDADSLRHLDQEILDLRARAGTTVVMVSHDAEQARRLGDAVTLLERGRARTGPPAEMLAARGASGAAAS